jgi:two-component system, chemotaxis family, chemotaxis protein CheY
VALTADKPIDVQHAGGQSRHTVKQVLVVDDSKVMREMIVACLRPEAELAFTHAASGLEAIEKLSLQRFDILLLDLNMPDIGGIEVVDFVRAQDTLRELPIIVVTTRGDEASRTKALEAGASRFMTKPFTPEALLSEVRKLLGLESAKL